MLDERQLELKRIYSMPWVLKYGVQGWKMFICSAHEQVLVYMPQTVPTNPLDKKPESCAEWTRSPCKIHRLEETPMELLKAIK